MPYSYVTVDTLKGTGALDITQSTANVFDRRIRELGEGISREIDRYANRRFHPIVGTFRFDGNGSTLLPVPDLVSLTALLEDDNGDGTFNVTWDADDYLLEPHNANPTADWGRPFHSIRVNPASNGTQDVFLRGVNNYRMAGTWGYWGVTVDSGLTTSGTHSATATTLTLSGAASGTILVGMALLVGTEQMYVTDVGSGTAATVTVSRGVNGAPSGSQGSGVAVNYYEYPPEVREAALIQVSRIWQRRLAGFASEAGFPAVGEVRIWRGGLDPDVQQLLRGYRRIPI